MIGKVYCIEFGVEDKVRNYSYDGILKTVGSFSNFNGAMEKAKELFTTELERLAKVYPSVEKDFVSGDSGYEITMTIGDNEILESWNVVELVLR